MNEQTQITPYLASIQDTPAYWHVGILWAMLATGEQTGGTYSLLWELCPQGSGPTPHFHDQDEQFYVIEGEITYLADGQELKARAGSFILIPRGTVHSFRVDSETATLLNSYTPAGFERVITELGEPAQARTLPPPHQLTPVTSGQMEKVQQLFQEVGMHIVHEPDVLRAERVRVGHSSPPTDHAPPRLHLSIPTRSTDDDSDRTDDPD